MVYITIRTLGGFEEYLKWHWKELEWCTRNLDGKIRRSVIFLFSKVVVNGQFVNISSKIRNPFEILSSIRFISHNVIDRLKVLNKIY